MIRTLFLLGIFLLCSLASTGQSADPLAQSYQPSRATATVAFYLAEIQKQTGIEISYSDAYLKGRRRVTLSGGRLSVKDVLDQLLETTGLHAVATEGRLLLVPGPAADAATTAILSGFIRDSASREVVIGGIVYVPELQRGTTTNAYGFYSLELPAGRHQVIVSAGGYQADTLRMQLSADLRRDVLLSYGLRLTGVTVSSRQDRRSDLVSLTRAELAQHAGLLGENDVLRGLQYTSGVQAKTEGNSNLVVRGGDPGQNLYLLDGVPLYYTDHILGVTSVFNTEAVKSVDFYKGGFPSRYGGRLSSIVDINSRDGDMKHLGGQASLGLLKGNLMLEGPIVKDKASACITARRTWLDALWRPFLDDYLGLDFYDVNLKANWIIDSKNRVYVSGYTGRDQLFVNALVSDARIRWGNSVGSLRWTSALRPNFFLNTSLSYSYFRYSQQGAFQENPFDSTSKIRYTGNSTIRDISLRVQADYYKTSKQHLQAGLLVSRSEFRPVDVAVDTSTPTKIKRISTQPFSMTELDVYVEDILKLSPEIELRAGLHTAIWLQDAGPNHYSLQPRLSAEWRINPKSEAYLSASRMSQFLHQLTNDATFYPSDFWVPSTTRLSPEHAWTFAGGYSLRPAKYTRLKAELYYKKLDQVLAYRAGSNVFESPVPWDQQVVQGEGWSYGLETELHQQLGPLRADLSYTLSQSTRRFAALNDGNAYPYRYDRRHCMKTALFFQRNKRFNAIAEYTYMSGEAVTIPDQLYPDYDKNITGQQGTIPLTYNYSARNNYRLPAIQRLDLAVNFIRYRGKRYERTWTLGVYNFLLNRNFIRTTIEQDGNGYKLIGHNFPRFIPTISYAVRF